MSRELVIQKVLGLGFVAVAIAYLSPMQLALCFSVLGQGHFLGAYFYQWKAGKLSVKGGAIFFALAVILLIPALITQKVEWFALGAGILFYIHHFQDEVTLFGKERSRYRLLEQLPPIILFSTLTADRLFLTSLTIPATLIILIPIALYIFAIIRKLYSPDVLSAYLFVITAGLAMFAWLQLPVAPEVVLSSIILFHYVCWYVHFYFRFAQNKERQLAYVRDMAAVHILVFAGFALFLYTNWGGEIFVYAFGMIYFYIWTILHILSSVRIQDYRSLAR